MEAYDNCSVKVAVHIRPLIADERQQGCRECVSVTAGKPQVQIGSHSFTFDHVYGNGGSPSSVIFEECIAPLVDGLFEGYNGTVLAYGQTGSGKTYTMGTGYNDSCQAGSIPKVMNALFNRIEKLKRQVEFQLHVSFIEILKEEVRDLLDSLHVGKSETSNGAVGKAVLGRPPIQIRESSNGVITLAGTNDIAVSTLQEMAACLEHGSLNRATGCTNMNNQSSRSHAIFTITLEQMHKHHLNSPISGASDEDIGEEYLCAKLHLVDLAGSERAKRTGSDGLRLKEGIHINKGLLALGNVISALGDEKKRKEGVHVPYRDSKLTRLLQDSLGGNSKTVMIACISPADINAEESLNTLKYANRARNIQNKPVVNRDLISNEMQKMQQQIKYLEAELCARAGGSPSDEVRALKEKIAWLEATNEGLSRDLHEYRSRCAFVNRNEMESPNRHLRPIKMGSLEKGLHSRESSDCHMSESISGESSGEIDVVAKEWEHELLQNTMDKELNELNKCLEQKESEMKLIGWVNAEALKQHFQKKMMELEEEKRILQQERDCLLTEVGNLSATTDGQLRKSQDIHAQNLKALESQILELKRKQESQVQLLKQKGKSEEAAKQLQAEIQFIKSQKVHLQNKMKQEAEQFRQWKACREKELLQLRKEGRRNEYERHKLEALNQRQKMVLQRKTEEAAMATKRLKELLEARKPTARENSVNGQLHPGQMSEKSLQRWLDHELEVMVKVHEVRFEFGKQNQVRAALEEELALLKQVDQFSDGEGIQIENSRYTRLLAMSPSARTTRIASIEHMLGVSSITLKAMASQLLEAEEMERMLNGRGCWNQLRSIGDAKSLLQYLFNTVADTRCRLWEKSMELKDMKEKVNELVALLQQSEAQRKELLQEQKLREQTVAIALSTSATGTARNSLKHLADELSGPLSPMLLPASKQLKYTSGIVNVLVREPNDFSDETRKMVPIGRLATKKLAAVGQAGKLWRWKRSHHQWLLQFKWKWQKPWKLSEWIKHSDETIMRSKSRQQALIDVM